ncbi:MAG TPA: hypothetical protein VGD17_20480 [Chitinophagaceae bacterium]
MKKLLQALVLCVCVSSIANAQQSGNSAKKDCGCSFSSINQAGLLEGSSGSAFQFQTINGMRYQKWFVGLGVGLDKYRFRTVPVFFDIRRDLLNKLNTPFLYGDIGASIPWVEDKDKTFWGRSEFDRGLFYDAGIGYKLNLGKGRAVLFSGGVSLKKIRETRHFDVACITFPCPGQSERYDFSLRRFSLKAGLQL